MVLWTIGRWCPAGGSRSLEAREWFLLSPFLLFLCLWPRWCEQLHSLTHIYWDAWLCPRPRAVGSGNHRIKALKPRSPIYPQWLCSVAQADCQTHRSLDFSLGSVGVIGTGHLAWLRLGSNSLYVPVWLSDLGYPLALGSWVAGITEVSHHCLLYFRCLSLGQKADSQAQQRKGTIFQSKINHCWMKWPVEGGI